MQTALLPLILCVAGLPDVELPQSSEIVMREPTKKKTFFVGQIFIMGNDRTLDCIYLSLLPFCCAQRVTEKDIADADKQISLLLAVFGIITEVALCDGEKDSKFRNVQVTVKESSFARLLMLIWDVAEYVGRGAQRAPIALQAS